MANGASPWPCREVPDAIVLDLMLAADGRLRRARSHLQADDRTRTIPVLVLTAKAQREDRVRCWEEGASEYMTKPFSPARAVRRR